MEKAQKINHFINRGGKEKPTLLPDQNKEKERMARIEKHD
jgi:hypothetical protein